MNLTWMDTISIMENMFDLESKDLAECLNVNPSTITRLKNGEIKKFKRYAKKLDELYSVFFDPIVAKSPAKGMTEETLLELLKYAIQEAGFLEVMEDLWEKKYEKGDFRIFVMTMLDLTKKNQASKRESIFALPLHRRPLQLIPPSLRDAAAQQLRNPLWFTKNK